MKIINNSLAHKLLILLLCVYFIFGAALLALRYWVPYKINDWRPQIETRMAKALDLDVSLDNINLHWQGWQPRVLINNVKLKDKEQQTLVEIPALSFILDWSGFFNGYAGLLKMHVQDMELNIFRTDSTHLNILNQDLDLLGDNFDIEIITALLDQPFISFTGATIKWHDLYRGAPELRLLDVSAILEQDNLGNLGLSLNAHMPQASMATLQFRGHLNKYDLKQSIENLTDFETWVGISNFKFSDWYNWIELPPGLNNNNANLQFWFDAKSAKRKVTMLAQGSDIRFNPDSQLDIQVKQAGMWLASDLGPVHIMDLIDPDRGTDLLRDVDFSLDLNQIFLLDQHIFNYPLDAELINANGKLNYEDKFELKIAEAFLQNQDIKLTATGTWQSGAGAGNSDFNANIAYANLASIYKYLPNDVDKDAHDWLKHGLISGDLVDGELYLKGDANEFPFGLKPEAGDFMVAGNFTNARIEFVPDAKPQEQWPQLYDMDGYAKLHRSSLELKSDSAKISPVEGSDISLSNLKGLIPDIEFDSVLSVTGNSKADGSTYIDLIKNTPLSHMLGGTFDEANASGNWQVPLSLTVPLSDSINTQVNGSVLFTDGELQFFPIAPNMTSLNGEVNFNEHGIFIDKAVSGVYLGGSFQLNGSLGGAAATGLHANGTITADVLSDYVGVYGMKRLTGSLSYQAVLKQQNSKYSLELNSSTENLGLDFPAPLSKPAGDKRSLHIVWSETANNNENLKISYGNVIKLDLLHKTGSSTGPYFHSAALGIERAANIEVPNGLSVDIDYPLIDLDNWEAIAAEFDRPLNPKQKQTKSRTIWPDIRLLSIQADQLRVMGTRLDRAIFRAVKKDETNWSLNINSDQTNGTIKWQENNGKILGTVKANFDQLSLGDDPDDTNSLLPESADIDRPINENLNIPGMVIEANNLRIFGKSFGHLNIEGTRDAVRKLWTLDRLRLGNNDTAMLKGTGTWYLSGEQRGLHLNADVVMKDLGQWMDNAGWKDILAGGAGDIKGKFFWKDLPWDTNKADLSGKMNVELANGRFIKLNSSSAKLLELLSLQSITRLNRLERGLMDLTEDGFPFDQLHGNMELEDGGVDIIDYKLTGPVATILLEGKANIIRRDMDMDAVVVPNIDVSGAAIAAGIAINPLVGLGAFVTQWLLKEPLAKSMTVRYKVSGSWDDPKTVEVPVSKNKKPESGSD